MPNDFARRVGGLIASALLLLDCQGANHEPTGGETHFLKRCDPSAASEACGPGFSCVCNLCTLPCTESSACGGLPAAECVAPADPTACGGGAPQNLCDVRCAKDADCGALSASYRCDAGVCRTDACVHVPGRENGVLWLGDSFFATTHQVPASLEALARASGALPTGAHYRDNSNLNANALAYMGNGIATQYEQGRVEAPVETVIMTGGGADALLGSCQTVDESCPVLVDAAAAARELLAKMASDGVRHVVYVFYPDPVDSNVLQRVNALRPLIQSACETSALACHWLDLRTSFAGHYAEYIQSDGLNPTSLGSQVTAAQIWAMMQRFCIAQ